jgi:hypothetical protein
VQAALKALKESLAAWLFQFGGWPGGNPPMVAPTRPMDPKVRALHSSSIHGGT